MQDTSSRDEREYCGCRRKDDDDPYFYWIVPFAFIAAALWVPTGRWWEQSLQLTVTIVSGVVAYLARDSSLRNRLVTPVVMLLGLGLVLAASYWIQARADRSKTGFEKPKNARAMQRGVLVVETLTFGPYLGAWFLVVGGIAKTLRIENLAFGFALMWAFITLPFMGIVPRLLPDPVPIYAALAQWGIVGLAVGRFTRDYSLTRTFGVAIGGILVISALTHFMIRAVGYEVIFEGP